MAVLVVLSSETQADSMARWGYHFAVAKKESLRIMLISKQSKKDCAWDFKAEEEFENPILEEARLALVKMCELSKTSDKEHKIKISFKEVSAHAAEDLVLKEIFREKVKLLLLAEHQRSRGGTIEYDLVSSLFESAPCDTIFLRPGQTEGFICNRILIPCAGGPHAKKALILARDIACTKKGEVTALYIQHDIGLEAKEVAKLALDKTLKEAKVEQDECVLPQIVLSGNVTQSIAENAADAYDLLLLGASNLGSLRRALFSTIPDKLLAHEYGLALGVFRAAKTPLHRLFHRIERYFDLSIPQLSRDERISFFHSIQVNSRWCFDFMALIMLSTAIAALGLLQNSAAVIIGAMLVAPLMTPLIGAGLAIVQGNNNLLLKSARAISYGFLVAFGISVLLGLAVPLPELSSELLMRGNPSLLDMGVGFFAGMAAAYCSARTNLSAALPGVAIAAALVPPIAASGISFALGEFDNALGAATLFVSNVVAIILGVSASLYASGIRRSKSSQRLPLLALRTLVGLLIIAAIFSIPLTSVLVSNLTPHIRNEIVVKRDLKKKFEELLLKHEVTLNSAKIDRKEKILMLTVGSANPVGSPLIEEIKGLAKKELDKDYSLSIKTELVQKIALVNSE